MYRAAVGSCEVKQERARALFPSSREQEIWFAETKPFILFCFCFRVAVDNPFPT